MAPPLLAHSAPHPCSHSPGTLVAKQPHAAAAARPLPSWVAACTSRAQPPLCWRWRAAPVDDVLVGPQGRCLPRRVEPAGLVELFRGRHLAFAGDSHERILHQHLAKALGGTGEESYHEDRTELIGSTGTRLDLWFRTLGGNLTAQVQNLTARGEEAAPPDLLLMGGGSWSILEEGRNVTRWEESLDELAPAVRRYLAALRRRGARPPVLVWATTPVRVKGRAARPVELPAELIPTFNAAAVARMVQPAGPFVLLDLYGITRGGRQFRAPAPAGRWLLSRPDALPCRRRRDRLLLLRACRVL